MLIHKTAAYDIYFGDASDQIDKPQEYLTTPAATFFKKTIAIQAIIRDFDLRRIFFAKQVHGVRGIQVTHAIFDTIEPFVYEADFLYTSDAKVGIGVMTADCLPVVICDRSKKCIAVVHAGWRGAFAGIVPIALQAMKKAYQVNFADLEIFLGPSARSCCYQVGAEFNALLESVTCTDNVLISKRDGLYCNIPALITNQLIAAHVPVQSIFHQYNICTICDIRFFSHRRDADRAGRQVTLVALR